MITKEQLAKENGELRAQVQNLSTEDSTLRKRFAKVLNHYESDRFSGSYKTASDLSWEEIFCEVGKLIAVQEDRRWKDGIDFRFEQIQSQLKGEKPV